MGWGQKKTGFSPRFLCLSLFGARHWCLGVSRQPIPGSRKICCLLLSSTPESTTGSTPCSARLPSAGPIHTCSRRRFCFAAQDEHFCPTESIPISEEVRLGQYEKHTCCSRSLFAVLPTTPPPHDNTVPIPDPGSAARTALSLIKHRMSDWIIGSFGRKQHISNKTPLL